MAKKNEVQKRMDDLYKCKQSLLTIIEMLDDNSQMTDQIINRLTDELDLSISRFEKSIFKESQDAEMKIRGIIQVIEVKLGRLYGEKELPDYK